MTLRGIGVSSGIGSGPAYIVPASSPSNDSGTYEGAQQERARFEAALLEVVAETKELHARALDTIGDSAAAIFEAHMTILRDPEFVDQIRAAIDSGGESAAMAARRCGEELAIFFSGLDDEYLRERAADIRDLSVRLADRIAGRARDPWKGLSEPSVVVARDLSPSDTARLDPKLVSGIVCAVGGRTSHAAIIARTLEIPTVLGLGEQVDEIERGDYVVVDGDASEVFVNPDPVLKGEIAVRRSRFDVEKAELRRYRDAEARTRDGRRIEVMANIGGVDEIGKALESGADGVGLFRSEFLFMNRDEAPSEEQQFQAYKAVVERLAPRPVIVRTLDIGGDKPIGYLGLPKEDNPFLGRRAIRLCLRNTALFRVHLRALLRASAFGALKLMFPMISSVQELRLAKAELAKAKAELAAEGVPFDAELPVGIMIEIPSAALVADALAKECDFFSIGTNDLTQYATAVDRGNESISELYSTFHPGVLKLVRMAAQAAAAAGIPCGICGEAAADERLIPALIGLGLVELSMSPTLVAKARKAIALVDSTEAAGLADELVALATSDEVISALAERHSKE